MTPATASDPLPGSENLPEVDLFTDGACIGNPGPGGWAFILRHRSSGTQKEQAGGMGATTNNRMEMLAVIEGLTALKRRSRVTVHSDSKYALQGICDWMPAWKRKGWRPRRGSGSIKNLDLWQRMDALVNNHVVAVNWIKGHSGHRENERCDALSMNAAQAIARNPQSPIDVRAVNTGGLFNRDEG